MQEPWRRKGATFRWPNTRAMEMEKVSPLGGTDTGAMETKTDVTFRWHSKMVGSSHTVPSKGDPGSERMADKRGQLKVALKEPGQP